MRENSRMDENARMRLWQDYTKTKSADIREKLILEYAPLVKLVAGRLSMYLGYNVEYDDLVSYGIFGLIDAIDKFEYALNLLDSQIADSVKLGFDEMKILADNGNDKAKIEIGITSFANEKNTIISQRRALLNKGNTRLSSELDVTIKYLSSINDESVITPEVYYILGGAYFYQGDKVNALKNFEKALALLNLNNDASHGYSNSVLKENLEYNISVLKNNE